MLNSSNSKPHRPLRCRCKLRTPQVLMPRARRRARPRPILEKRSTARSPPSRSSQLTRPSRNVMALPRSWCRTRTAHRSPLISLPRLQVVSLHRARPASYLTCLHHPQRRARTTTEGTSTAASTRALIRTVANSRFKDHPPAVAIIAQIEPSRGSRLGRAQCLCTSYRSISHSISRTLRASRWEASRQ